ncbi:MAG: hypothetical protein NT027_18765, partial [Proteobacteria bacterium]|nr:hypothetical protein [Pseudomonadota bacterium]
FEGSYLVSGNPLNSALIFDFLPLMCKDQSQIMSISNIGWSPFVVSGSAAHNHIGLDIGSCIRSCKLENLPVAKGLMCAVGEFQKEMDRLYSHKVMIDWEYSFDGTCGELRFVLNQSLSAELAALVTLSSIKNSFVYSICSDRENTTQIYLKLFLSENFSFFEGVLVLQLDQEDDLKKNMLREPA